jgi:uncharacterized protein
MRWIIAFAGLLTLAGCAATPRASVRSDKPVPLQYLPALAGDYFAINSVPVGRKLHIYVRLPEDYAKYPDRIYPTVYLLDGDSTFPMLAPEHLFLTYDEKLPEAVVVGIAYGGFGEGVNFRNYDFREVMPDGSPGGAAKFLSFLSDELIPKVESEFRADVSRRILVGQSRGAGFVVESAASRPALFWGRIASNPGLGHSRALKVPDLAAMPAGHRLIVTSGTRDRADLRAGALVWRDAIARLPGSADHLEMIDIPGGTHAASLTQAYRAGMLRLFGINPDTPAASETSTGN